MTQRSDFLSLSNEILASIAGRLPMVKEKVQFSATCRHLNLLVNGTQTSTIWSRHSWLRLKCHCYGSASVCRFEMEVESPFENENYSFCNKLHFRSAVDCLLRCAKPKRLDITVSQTDNDLATDTGSPNLCTCSTVFFETLLEALNNGELAVPPVQQLTISAETSLAASITLLIEHFSNTLTHLELPGSCWDGQNTTASPNVISFRQSFSACARLEALSLQHHFECTAGIVNAVIRDGLEWLPALRRLQLCSSLRIDCTALADALNRRQQRIIGTNEETGHLNTICLDSRHTESMWTTENWSQFVRLLNPAVLRQITRVCSHSFPSEQEDLADLTEVVRLLPNLRHLVVSEYNRWRFSSDTTADAYRRLAETFLDVHRHAEEGDRKLHLYMLADPRDETKEDTVISSANAMVTISWGDLTRCCFKGVGTAD